MAQTELALHALNWAVDKLPDSLWHGLPGGFFKPKDKDTEKLKEDTGEKRVERRRSGSDFKSKNRRHGNGDRKGRHRRAASASPYQSDYSDEELDRHVRRGRRRRQSHHDDKYDWDVRGERTLDRSSRHISSSGRPSTTPLKHPHIPGAFSPATFAGIPTDPQSSYPYTVHHVPPVSPLY